MSNSDSSFDCIFCKIVKGKLPCFKVYEDKSFLAFLNVNPVNKGHVLIIPKKHYETILDMPNDALSQIILIVKKITKAILRIFNIDSCNIDINLGKEAGQIVPHVHIHIIPRFSSDEFKEWPTKQIPEEEMQEIANKIKNSL